jgi:hypothetical protein
MSAARASVVVAGLVSLVAAVQAPAAPRLAAVSTRIGAHPAYVRVVVDFIGGRLGAEDFEAVDHAAADGSVLIRVRRRNIQADAAPARAAGVRARVLGARNRLDFRVRASAQRFKYVMVSALHAPERLVADLYRSWPPGPGAEIRTGRGGCLSLAQVVPGRRSFTVRGRELHLFEHSFLLRVRDGRGRVVGERVMTAAGRWSAVVRYRVAARQRGTVEAVADSAKDGALACIAQVGAPLAPSQLSSEPDAGGPTRRRDRLEPVLVRGGHSARDLRPPPPRTRSPASPSSSAARTATSSAPRAARPTLVAGPRR